MRFLKGLKILVTKTWYNISFVLSMAATAIITAWILVQGSLTPNITDPVQGLGISIVVSFQYFVIILILSSLTEQGRAVFFEGRNQLRNQVILCVAMVLLFMALGGASAIIGPVVGAGLTFLDASITAYFTVLLGWNVAEKVSQSVGEKKGLEWLLFGIFLLVDVMVFGYLYMYVGIDALLFGQQIVLLMFPLGVIILPVLTVYLREENRPPKQTTLMTLVLFGLGLYYTFRLVNVSDPQFTLIDMALQFILLIYGLSTTVVKVEEASPGPLRSIALILLVILSRVGTQVNRLLAAATAWGNIVQIGVLSFTILNLAVLGLLIPAYWMWKRQKTKRE
ncbi:hypothetical protein EU546_03805 [Candidatus Thorarchaeota archaeon]|nr:MAG: hypothetical protein EU546_03805 [Candidatus Thorarchaeota archaeon]